MSPIVPRDRGPKVVPVFLLSCVPWQRSPGPAHHGRMTITFITGANKGLGRETARRLIEQGHTVLLGARDVAAGTAAADELGARFVQIDVTDDASVAAAAADVERHEGAVDVLINNAGIAGPSGDPSTL